jgi:hypothetical protein
MLQSRGFARGGWSFFRCGATLVAKKQHGDKDVVRRILIRSGLPLRFSRPRVSHPVACITAGLPCAHFLWGFALRLKTDHGSAHVFYGVFVLFTGQWYRVGPWSASVHEAEAKMADLCALHRGLCFQLRDTDQHILNAFGTPPTENSSRCVPVA